MDCFMAMIASELPVVAAQGVHGAAQSSLSSLAALQVRKKTNLNVPFPTRGSHSIHSMI